MEEEALAAEVFGIPATAWERLEENHTKNDEERDRAAWIDEDDDRIQVDISKTKRLKKLRKVEKERNVDGIELESRLRERYAYGREAKWAADARKKLKERTPAESKTEAFLRSDQNEFLLDEKESRLDILRCPDANAHKPASAVIQAVDFSGDISNLMLTAGLDKQIRLFRIDGNENFFSGAYFCKDLPILCAAFCGKKHNSNKIAASGRRPYFYFIDIETSKTTRVTAIKSSQDKSLERFCASSDGTCLAFSVPNGRILTCDPRNGLWSHSELRINGTTRALTFDYQNSLYLYAAGSDAQVYSWDLRHTRRCLHKFRDPGQSITSALAAHNGKLAVASESGIVNIFHDYGSTFIKAITNLTTPVDRLAFHPTEDLLVLSSKWTKDALRIVNVRTLIPQVYAHWPTNNTPLHYVSATTFSPYGDFLAIGNDRGRVLLYKVKRPQ
eukprot:CAMPEP_0197291608 /NCGR_PEP_ID=MMETSP0890-20130614/17465_1 /TAXON_ID=44058 ORGANISM="Aureoumbra lagunensis, Strain CCMP1510" /NCGR_SAMPLE_ID=MMETSP0890 /ASSEMBLY_ACC=CAM_ASM_000533 /LENGTH=443 /DNA_ID=CAMNT_0042764813 /DNA_START=245 /DNA_END=1576 /DNA_ORIENTATION=+